MAEKPTRTVLKAVVKIGDKFLVLKRSPDAEFFPKLWEFPGGWPGPETEDAEDALEGKVKDETGIFIHVLPPPKEYVVDCGDRVNKYEIYETRFLFGDVLLSEIHSEFGWLTQEEVKKMPIAPDLENYFK